MKHKNLTRNALFTSIISLLLCVSMLVGTTFAWFTDSVDSGVNTIASGNLDVELYHGKDKDPVDKVTSNTLLFTDVGGNVIDLWEPGVVAFTNLKVANVGTLALKYQLSINSTEMNTVKDTELTLADALKVAVVEGGVSGTREQVIGAVADNAWTKLESFTLPGVLEADKKSETYGIVVYWQPGDNAVDNQFNMNNGKTTSNGEPLTITLGVNLFATQEMYEDDSFGPDYDEDAWVDGFDVYTEQDLNAAIANGETAIDLMADIALTETLEIPAGTAVKLNLSGYELSGNKTKDSGAAIVNNGTLSIYGGEMSNNAVNGAAVIENNGSLTLDGVTVKGAPMDSTGYPEYAVVTYGKLTVEEGTAIVADRGAIRTYAGAEVVINGGSFTVSNAADGRNMTFHTIYAYGNGAKLTINDGYFEQNHTSTGGASVICPAGASIDIYGGDFRDAMDDTNWTSTGNFQNYMNYTAPVNVYGGTFDDATVNKNLASGYKAVESNGKYIVVSENVDGVVTTAAGLADAIAQGGVVSVMADIDMNNAWTSVVPANGLVIEGNDHVISNLNLPLMAGKGGPTVTVKGLTIADSNVGIAANEKGLGTGAFIAFADYSGTLVFEDCHLVNSTVTGNERAAAFVGYSYAGVTIRDCSVDKCTITAVGSTAALIGHANGVTTIEKTSVTNTKVTATEDRTGSTAVAGSLIGTVANTTALNNVTASNNTVSNTGATPYSAEFGRIVSPGKLIVDGAELKTASSQAALDAAVSSTGNVEITLTNGEYKMPSSGTTGEVTITGTKDTVLDMTMGAYMESANVTIDGVTIKTSTGMVNGNGADYAALYTPNVTYKDCTFVGPLREGRDGAKFINCPFTELGNDYVWTYGNDVTIEGCTFNTDGKAILLYSDGGNEVAKVTVKNCVFNSTQGAKAGAIANQNCAAIEIHNYGNGVNLVTEGNTFDSNFSGEWRIKTYETDRTQIFVNGTEYTTIAIDGKTMTIDANKNVTVQ